MAYHNSQRQDYQQYGSHPTYPPQNGPVAYPQVVIPAPTTYQPPYAQQQYHQPRYAHPQYAPSLPVNAQWQNGIPQTMPQSTSLYHYPPQQYYTDDTIRVAPLLPQVTPQSIQLLQPEEVQIPPITRSVQDAEPPPLDYQVLLLALADEYLDAAHGQGMVVALAQREAQMRQYYQLVAAGLGCLESLLQNYRHQPRMEALITLRYAKVLYEETSNDLEAEQALSKGIELCDRNRLLDLKYTMQQLLARVLHRSSPRAALKAVDKMIEDVEAYQHVAWNYAFRFLRITLSLASSSHHDILAAIHHLQKLSALASRQADKAIRVFAAVVEALVHLQFASSESLEQAQRALAIARSHQLEQQVAGIPQLNVLIRFVDLCCSLQDANTEQAMAKMESMQAMMDQMVKDPKWTTEGSFAIPLSQATSGILQTPSGGGIMRSKGGGNVLMMDWLPKKDVYSIGYLLSAAARSHRNATDGHKAERLLLEGLSMTRGRLLRVLWVLVADFPSGNLNSPEVVTQSAIKASNQLAWRQALECQLLLEMVFLLCSRTDWEGAQTRLAELEGLTTSFGENLPAEVGCLSQYLRGAILQGTGHLDEALAVFRGPTLSLQKASSKSPHGDVRRDMSILAALNSLLILRNPLRTDDRSFDIVLSSIEPSCQSTSNKQIQAAYYLVKAISQTDSTLKTKQYLSQALQAARTISNNQITAITLGLMSWKYFKGVVGEQAEKSARAGHAMAKKAGNHLWVSVADAMLADTLEKQGKTTEAAAARDEAMRVALSLPDGLKKYAMSS